VRRAALEVIDRHPADYLPHDVAGRAYARRGAEVREALAFVNRALFLRPLDAEAHRTAARSLLRLGRRDQSLLEYRSAAQALEQDAPAVLAEAASVAKGLDELLILTPPEPVRVCDVSQWLWTKDRGKEAVALLDWGARTLGGRPDSGPLWMQLAAVRTARREFPEALAALEQAEARQPEEAGPVRVHAETLWAMGRREEAVGLLESRILRQPGSVGLSFLLAEKLLAQRAPRRALDVLLRAGPFVGSTAQRSRLFTLQAQAFELQGRNAKALEAYQSASRLEPEAVPLHYELARLYEGMGKHGDAIRELREGMRWDSPQGVEAARGRLAHLEEAEREVQEQHPPRPGAEGSHELEDLLDGEASSPGP
jgi:tetratricopeptide (TPR) repeat protein